MIDQRIGNLAKILVHYSAAVQKNEKVIIRGYPLDPIATPLIKEIYREVLKAGGHPHILVNIEDVDFIHLMEASEQQLLQPNLFDKLIAEEFDVDFRIGSDTNTRRLNNTDPEAQKLLTKGFKDVNETWWKRVSSEELRFVVSRYPTLAYAQDAKMSLTEFSDFLFKSTFADLDDPISAWNQMHEKQEHLVQWLDGKENVKITGNGIDLDMSIAGRKFLNADGRGNVPDGEIFTSPVEDSVNGIVKFSFPCIWLGVEVNGVELHFENGKVVKASAEKNEEFLLKIIETDDGAKRLGELGIGTNNQIKMFTQNILFDEKIGGTIHLALGNGFPPCGSENNSVIHWDMITDMRDGGQIFVDDELFYDSGKFVI